MSEIRIDEISILDFIFDMKIKPYTMVIRTYPVRTFTLFLVKGPATDPMSKVVGQAIVKNRMDAIWIRDDVAKADNPEEEFKKRTRLIKP